jgi:predicted RNA-binding protein with PIN domain
VIFAWDSLRELAAVNIDSACDKLADILSNYAAFREIKLLLVFDAYRTPAVTPHSIAVDGIEVVYTKSGQTCDAFIESFCSENQKKFRMRVVTNDGMVQLSIMSLGALRMSVGELKSDVEDTERRIRKIIGGE